MNDTKHNAHCVDKVYRAPTVPAVAGYLCAWYVYGFDGDCMETNLLEVRILLVSK